MHTLNRLTIFVPAVTGLLALALPFTGRHSPVTAISFLWDPWFREFGFLSAAAFLTIPIAAFQVRRLVADRVASVAVVLSYAVSAAAVLPILVLSVHFVLSLISGSEVWLLIASGGVCWAFAVINLLLLVRNLAKRLPREVTAEVFLLGGYFPNAVWCLAMFYAEGSGWEVGAYLVLGTCIGYLSRILFLLWRRGEDAPRPIAPVGEPAQSPHAHAS